MHFRHIPTVQIGGPAVNMDSGDASYSKRYLIL